MLNMDNYKVKYKLLLLYVLAVLVPILLTNYVFYRMTADSVEKQRVRDLTASVERVQSQLRQMIEEGARISHALYANSLVNDALDQRYASLYEFMTVYDRYLKASIDLSPAGSEVSRVTIYTDNPTIPSSGGLVQIDDGLRATEWFPKAVQAMNRNPRQIYLTGYFERSLLDNAHVRTLSLIRQLDAFHASQSYKFVKIDFDLETVDALLRNENFEGSLVLSDAEGRVIYSDRRELLREAGFLRVGPEELLRGDEIVLRREFGSVSYMRGWSISGIYPRSIMLDSFRHSKTLILGLGCINILIPGLIILVISRSFHTRLLRIVKQMAKLKNQQFETIDDISGNDEISQLMGEFNRMALQIKNLIRDVYEADLHKKNLELGRTMAELNALQSQINPHFLFNTLESIRMRSLIKGERETASMIHYLSRSFRRTLTWGNDFVTLRDEMQFVEEFLLIQQYRFGDKLIYRIEAGEEALRCVLPKLSVIPLVENACMHGIESIRDPGIVRITASLSDGRLRIGVKDNGSGIARERLQVIQRYLERGGELEGSVGIRNVYLRLSLYYPERFSFRLSSEAGSGTEALIELPALDRPPGLREGEG